MPRVKVGAGKQGKVGGGHVSLPAPPAVPPHDVELTPNRSTIHRTAADAFMMGITPQHHSFPSGALAGSISRAQALNVSINWDIINIHSHHFGWNGPKINIDHTNNLGFAQRNSWTGWNSWDTRTQRFRLCKGASTKLMVVPMPPGWAKMDGGHKTDKLQDPLYINGTLYNVSTGTTAEREAKALALARSWDGIDDDSERRHTDLHRADMVDLCKAIVERHPDVDYVCAINEQKGNFVPQNNTTVFAAEISSDGISYNTSNYIEQARYQDALDAALVGSFAAEVMGPYNVLECSGADLLAATVPGFPQPDASASVALNRYRQSADTAEPVNGAQSNRNVLFMQQWYDLTTANGSRGDWFALDWKVFGNDNYQLNWDVIYPYRWYLYEMVRKAIQNAKAAVSAAPRNWTTFKLIAMETYGRKVQDLTNVPGDQEQAAMCAEMLRIEIEEKVKCHLRWAPEMQDGGQNRLNLYRTTKTLYADDAAMVLPAWYVYKHFADYFRGVNIYLAASTDAHEVSGLSTLTHTFALNKTSTEKKVLVGSELVTIPAYSFAWVNDNP